MGTSHSLNADYIIDFQLLLQKISMLDLRFTNVFRVAHSVARRLGFRLFVVISSYESSLCHGPEGLLCILITE